jgi:hypothetical protein
MAAGIDGARLMKVAWLRMERGKWNGVGRLEEASGGSQRRTGRKDQKFVGEDFFFLKKESSVVRTGGFFLFFWENSRQCSEGKRSREGRECCDEVGRRRRVSSSVAESLGQDRDFSLRLMCGLAHCCRRTQREREEELEGQSAPPVL